MIIFSLVYIIIIFSVRNPFVFKLHWKEEKDDPLTKEDKKDEFPEDYEQAFPDLLNRYILHLYNKISNHFF